MQWTAELAYSAPGLSETDTTALSSALPTATVHYQPSADRLHITITVDAATLRAAADAALTTTGTATGLLKPTRMHILPSIDYDTQIAHPPVQDLDLIGVTEIAAELGVSRQRAGQLTADPDFPAPVVHVAAGRLYTRASVQAFHDRWAAIRNTRGGPRRRQPAAPANNT